MRQSTEVIKKIGRSDEWGDLKALDGFAGYLGVFYSGEHLKQELKLDNGSEELAFVGIIATTVYNMSVFTDDAWTTKEHEPTFKLVMNFMALYERHRGQFSV